MGNKKKYKAIIETPEGDNRRRHFNKEKTKIIDLGPLKNVIPINNGIAPINYGFILNTYCKADNDEVDALIISEDKLRIGQEIEVYPIALILRKDKDDKIVAVDKTTFEKYQEWHDVSKEKRDLIEKFFSFHYDIITIENSKKARQYLLINAK